MTFSISKQSIKVKGHNMKTLVDMVEPHDGEILLIRNMETLMGYTTEAEIKEIREKVCRTNTEPTYGLENRF